MVSLILIPGTLPARQGIYIYTLYNFAKMWQNFTNIKYDDLDENGHF